METTAVYSERRVRTYGLQAQDGLALLRADCPLPKLAGLGQKLSEGKPVLKPVFLTVQRGTKGLGLVVCVSQEQASTLARALRDLKIEAGAPQETRVIHLQGPHFGERYGIMAKALQALQEVSLPPLAFAGVVHSLYLALAPGQASRALQALAEHFAAPGVEP